MKRTLLTVGCCILALRSSHAALLLDEPFNYPDGPLVDVSGGRWTTHGGTSNQIQVAGSEVTLRQSDTEDVNAGLTGGPFRGPALYAALALHFSALPTGDGAYFAHFKDSTATGFRGRLYATTNGASAGRFRVGLANGAEAPTYIPTDLQLGIPYTLLLRYQSASSLSTLWLDPVSESSVRDRADATEPSTALNIVSFGLRQVVAGGDGIGTLRLSSIKVGTAFLDVIDNFDPRRDPPELSAIPDQNIPANTSTPAVPLLVHDAETAAESLLLSSSSDHPELVGPSGVVFGGGGSNRTVTVTPTPGRQGVARVTVMVTDADGNTANGTFQVTVGVPTISPIPDQVTPQNTTLQIPFWTWDAEFDKLEFQLVSTNDSVLPNQNLKLQAIGTNRVLVAQPRPDAAGTTRITIFVTDGFNLVSNQFLVTVSPTRGLVLSDDFTYADGSVVTNSQFTWVTHGASSGQTGQTQVIQGRLLLSNAQSEDIHALLVDAPYSSEENWVLFARMTVNFRTRPSSGGDYFGHFRSVSSGFGARLYATTSGAAVGRLRLGIANSAGTPVLWPTDLETNQAYIVITRFNAATGQSTLWVEPNAGTPGVDATDTPSPFDVYAYAFRQSSGIGSLWVDELRIATAWSDLFDSGYHIDVRPVGAHVELSWPRAATEDGFRLEACDDLASALWEELSYALQPLGEAVMLRLEADSGMRYFRLAK